MYSTASRVLMGRAALAGRGFHTSARRMADAAPLVAKKPMGAFRGGLFGFLLGCTVAGSSVYTYLVQEYKTSNDLLSEDIYTLQASVTRLTNYVKNLEQIAQEKKK
ncbi:hypothetical protein CCM_06951 [Cordyceps militaris CM01]|uniref:Uncharacterized protein n=2 Tax=Cordyceps militaris TaxID=73501 RepID=G3JLF7_CORMM|nr:uncharacterized protein CCM_06951 [Cordyceps militaris CM01]ATY62055.1 hypothetical protein A9K55_007960 [Cordyceps militaris]EGX90531.1 hypothetical protein CCM_06951 [Cordyceps militaris CM01]